VEKGAYGMKSKRIIDSERGLAYVRNVFAKGPRIAIVAYNKADKKRVHFGVIGRINVKPCGWRKPNK